MKERKPDGGLAEWIETLEAMGGEDDGEMLCLLLELRRFREDKPELIEHLEALSALAEERREFIVNGVEFGYIRIPEVKNDKATGTYERCLLKPKYAADAILNEVRSQAVQGSDDTKRMDWLVAHHVEVRKPLVYGSQELFVAQCDSDDHEEHHTTLREQIDAARIRAGEVPHA